MTNHPPRIEKNMNELVGSNTIEKQKKSFLRDGVPSWHMVKNRVQPKMRNIGTIYDLKIGDELEEILFGCAVCANGRAVNSQEPCVVTLIRKVRKNYFAPTPSSFSKNAKN